MIPVMSKASDNRNAKPESGKQFKYKTAITERNFGIEFEFEIRKITQVRLANNNGCKNC